MRESGRPRLESCHPRVMRIRLVRVCVALAAARLHADDLDIRRRVAAEEEAATDEWTELPDERRVAILRARLGSEDAGVAYLAARARDAHCLDFDRFARAWLDRSPFQRSRILGGLLPVH